MATDWVEFEFDQGNVLFNLLAQLSNFDKQTVLDDIQAIGIANIRRRFLDEEAPDGTKWEPSYSALVRKSGGYTWSNGKLVTGGGTLFATGRLWRSLQASKEDDSTRAFGTDVPYAPQHQLGNRGGTPFDDVIARPFLGFSNEDIAVFEKIINDKIEEIKNKTVGGGPK